MAKFLTTSEITSSIEKIIKTTKSKLVIISPYLKLSPILFERLKDTERNKVSITIIYGKDDLKSDQEELLAKLDNLRLYYYKNLHAKCYFNENQMVITSMNMLEFSEKNNREMGVLISREHDRELFNQAMDEALSILKAPSTWSAPQKGVQF